MLYKARIELPTPKASISGTFLQSRKDVVNQCLELTLRESSVKVEGRELVPAMLLLFNAELSVCVCVGGGGGGVHKATLSPPLEWGGRDSSVVRAPDS